MTSSRRHFLQLSLGAASLLAIGARGRPSARSGPGKRLLILGGTWFPGPALVHAAQARGEPVPLFNRGKTRPSLFPDVEKLHGDRDPKKGDGLKALAGRKWDAVIDPSG